MEDLGGVQAIEDRITRPEGVERLRLEQLEIAARLRPLWAPVRARRDRRVGWIAREVEAQPIDAALGDRIAPVLIKVREQHGRVRDRAMNVAVDRRIPEITARLGYDCTRITHATNSTWRPSRYVPASARSWAVSSRARQPKDRCCPSGRAPSSSSTCRRRRWLGRARSLPASSCDLAATY